LATLDIVTLTEAKAHLNKPASSTSDDAEIAGFISAASEKVDELAGAVVQRAVTETHSGGYPRGVVQIVLRVSPVVSVSSVTQNAVVVDPTLYSVNTTTGVITRTTSYTGGLFRTWFLPGTDNIVVAYTAGRVPTTADVAANCPTLRLACLELIAHWWRLSQLGQSSNRGSQLGGADSDSYALHGMGYAVPNRVNELIGRQGRTPAVG
jgi:hypothetical protein